MGEQDKNKDLDADRKHDRDGRLTTNQGIPVSDNQNSLKAGSRGPTLLEDFVLREKITSFDHERIPERVVHARGSAAHGYFQVYESLAKYSKAKLFADPAVKTPVFARFSTVVGFRGSADTVRDARGFAVKFYTDDGNWDLVGNNMPVFFIQDAIKFPDLVHALKPEPHNEMPQAASAHDNFYDFAWLTPEATHMIMWTMSDRALPRSLRMMEGFGVNTFRLVNAAGKSVLVKFHWKPLLGVHGLVWDEAQKLAGKDSDFHRRDLWENIELGNFPEWEFAIQVIEEADERRFDFDPLDPTKLWPESQVPLLRVGKMVLNRNPDNYFAETEQVAFCPANIVPGVDFSDDPLLQGRLFSYLDTQLLRLGGPNFHEIPINRPTCPVTNTNRDGHQRHTVNVGKTNYQPNSRNGGCPMQNGDAGFVTYPERIDARKVRERSESFNDHFTQATLFWNSMSEPEQEHIVDAYRFELAKVESKDIRARMVDILLHVDQGLAHRVAYGIGVPVSGPGSDLASARKRLQEGWAKYGTTGIPGAKVAASTPATAPELSMANNPKDTIKTRKVAFLIADGVDGDQVDAVKSAITKAGAVVELIAATLSPLQTAAGKSLQPDKTFLTMGSIMYDAVFVPGGAKSVGTLRAEGDALHFINEAFRHCKTIAATSDGVDLLVSSNITDPAAGAKQAEAAITAVPGIIAERAPADLKELARRFIAAIAEHRHFARQQKERVPA